MSSWSGTDPNPGGRYRENRALGLPLVGWLAKSRDRLTGKSMKANTSCEPGHVMSRNAAPCDAVHSDVGDAYGKVSDTNLPETGRSPCAGLRSRRTDEHLLANAADHGRRFWRGAAALGHGAPKGLIRCASYLQLFRIHRHVQLPLRTQRNPAVSFASSGNALVIGHHGKG